MSWGRAQPRGLRRRREHPGRHRGQDLELPSQPGEQVKLRVAHSGVGWCEEDEGRGGVG
jgi:hypothetical protein